MTCTRVTRRDAVHEAAGAIGRIVVDDEHMCSWNDGQYLIEQQRYIVTLIVRGDNISACIALFLRHFLAHHMCSAFG